MENPITVEIDLINPEWRIHPSNSIHSKPLRNTGWDIGFTGLENDFEERGISYTDIKLPEGMVSLVQLDPSTLGAAVHFEVPDNSKIAPGHYAHLKFKRTKLYTQFFSDPEITAEYIVPRQYGIVRWKDNSNNIYGRRLDTQDFTVIKNRTGHVSFESLEDKLMYFVIFNWQFKDEHEKFDSELAQELKKYTEKNKIILTQFYNF